METKFSVDEIEPFCKWQKEEQQDVLEVHLQGGVISYSLTIHAFC